LGAHELLSFGRVFDLMIPVSLLWTMAIATSSKISIENPRVIFRAYIISKVFS